MDLTALQSSFVFCIPFLVYFAFPDALVAAPLLVRL